MRVPILLLILLGLLSCTQSPQTKQTNTDTSAPVSEQKEVPLEFFKEKAKQIGLNNPTEKDSFVLRLWIGSMVKPDRVIELRNVAGSWHSEMFEHYTVQDGRVFYKPIPIKSQKHLAAVVDSLRRVDFAKLITQDRIPGFVNNVADGVTYNMEIFEPFRYQHLKYHCPEYYYSQEPNNRKFVDIVKLLDRHFKFYLPLCEIR